MRFLKQLCIPPRSHFKFNTGNTQRWHLSMAWLTVFVMALTFVALARPTLVSAAVQYNQRIQFQDDFDSCLGERILVDGTQHIVGRVLEDADAGKGVKARSAEREAALGAQVWHVA